VNINLYGRARRLSLYRSIVIVLVCIVAIIVLISLIFKNTNKAEFTNEYDLLKNYFINRGYSCELLNVSGSRCVSTTDNVKTTFYRFDDGFEYVVKTDSYSLVMVHRLDKKNELTFKTTSSAFDGYKNQTFICHYESNVLDKVSKCESAKDSVILDVKSYLGVIESAQVDLTNAINSSGYSLESLLLTYEWIKK